MSQTEVLPSVTLSASAAVRVRKVLSREAPGSVLRVAVDGGGCSGFQYSFAVVQGSAADDLVLERDGAVVVIDPVSIDYMKGSEIDFVDDLIGQSFKIHNPKRHRVLRLRHQLRAVTPADPSPDSRASFFARHRSPPFGRHGSSPGDAVGRGRRLRGAPWDAAPVKHPAAATQ